MAAATVKAKKKCCGDKPRCKRCRVTCKRLEAEGYYERQSKRLWIVEGKPPKKVMRAARAR
jgi:hypothetical protein